MSLSKQATSAERILHPEAPIKAYRPLACRHSSTTACFKNLARSSHRSPGHPTARAALSAFAHRQGLLLSQLVFHLGTKEHGGRVQGASKQNRAVVLRSIRFSLVFIWKGADRPPLSVAQAVPVKHGALEAAVFLTEIRIG